MNVPHELPGTSRLAGGRNQPTPFHAGRAPHVLALRDRQPKRRVEVHRFAGFLAEFVGGERRHVVDFRAVGEHPFLEIGPVRINQHRSRLHGDFLAAQRLDDDDAQAGQRDDDDIKNRHGRRDPRRAADFVARDRREAAPAASYRGRQHHHVLHRARQANADDQPDQTGQISELNRQDRPDQRPRAGDRGEVVAEQHPAIGGVVILPVVELMRGGRPRVVERGDAARRETHCNSGTPRPARRERRASTASHALSSRPQTLSRRYDPTPTRGRVPHGQCYGCPGCRQADRGPSAECKIREGTSKTEKRRKTSRNLSCSNSSVSPRRLVPFETSSFLPFPSFFLSF